MTEWIDARAIIIIEGKVKEPDKALVEKVLNEWAKRMRELISLKWNKLMEDTREGSCWAIDNTLAGQAHCNLRLHSSGGKVQFEY